MQVSRFVFSPSPMSLSLTHSFLASSAVSSVTTLVAAAGASAAGAAGGGGVLLVFLVVFRPEDFVDFLTGILTMLLLLEI